MSPDTLGHGQLDAVADGLPSATAVPSEADGTAEYSSALIAPDEFVAAPSKAMEITVAVVALAFNIAFLIGALNIELRQEAGPGQIDARFWPTILAVLGIVLSAWRLLVSSIRPPDDRSDLEATQPGTRGQLLITLLLTLGYLGVWSLKVITFHVFGLVIGVKIFILATPIFLAALLFIFGSRSWKAIVIFPIVTTAFIYLLFGQLLRIAL